MPNIASKTTYDDIYDKGVWADVTLDDGRTGTAKDGGVFRRGSKHVALTRAIQDANSKPIPTYDPTGCFPGDAKVSTPNGLRRIDSIRKDEQVISFDQDGLKLNIRRVTKVIGPKLRPITQVTFTSERGAIRATLMHKVLTKRGWTSVSALKPGDQLVAVDNSQIATLVVSAVSQISIPTPVFNLITEGEHNFIVDGVIAHNFSFFRRLRTFLFDVSQLAQTGELRIARAI